MWENIRKERNSWVSLIWFAPIGVTVCFFIKLFLPSRIVYNEVTHYPGDAGRDELIFFFLAGMFVISLLFVFKWVRYGYSIKKYRKQLDEISNDIEKSNYMHAKGIKLYATMKYILEYRYKINIFNIDDILWIYPKKNTDVSRYGSVTKIYYTIEFMLKNGKTFPFISYLYEGCELEEVNELINYIKSNNSNIVVGYTDENIKYFKDKGYKVY